jgi:hypothetical protein
VAVKITNNSSKDIIFGTDFKLAYTSGTDITLVETERMFTTLKQKPLSHLLYLLLYLLLPVVLNVGTTTTSNGFVTTTQPANSFPIGLLLGPAIAGGNVIVASTANKNFKNDLMKHNLVGKTIKTGETVYGLVGLYSNSYDSIKIKR